MKMPAFASSHHRLLWIHPFRDGNGRVARLFTIAYQYRLGIWSHGLWTVTRAFARNRSEYDRHLALADQPRRNDFDGRGPLSEENLTVFCKYFLAACIDQLRFMESILELEHLEKRFKQYLAVAESQKILSKASVSVLDSLIYKGEISRGEVQALCNVKRRRATNIIKELLDKGFVRSVSAHGGLTLSFSGDLAPHLFPKLV
jgi:Fic family protein